MANILIKGQCTPYSGVFTIRDAAILTNAEVDTDILVETENYRGIKLDAFFTLGSLTDVRIRMYTSDDGTNWVAEPSLADTSGVILVNSDYYKITADKNIFLTFQNVAAKYIKFTAEGTGTVTGSSLKLNAKLFNGVSFSRF